MKKDYTLFGRGKELHSLRLVKFDLTSKTPYTFLVETEYPVQTTNRVGEILMLDLSGGPKFIVGDTFEKHTITNIEFIDKKFYIKFK